MAEGEAGFGCGYNYATADFCDYHKADKKAVDKLTTVC
jgi:hypothetical protein